MQVTASATLGLIKLSIFLFYAEVFWVLDWCRWTIHIGASLSSAFYLAMTIVQFYFMTPRPGETMAEHFGGDMAARVTTLSIPTTSVGLAVDILLLAVPLRAVTQLRLAKRKKVRLILTFLIGVLYVLVSPQRFFFSPCSHTYLNQRHNWLSVKPCLQNQDVRQSRLDLPSDSRQLFHVRSFLLFFTHFYNLFLSLSINSSIEMIFGICIACAPFVHRTAKHHQQQVSNVTQSLVMTLNSLPSFVSPVRSSSKEFSGHNDALADENRRNEYKIEGRHRTITLGE